MVGRGSRKTKTLSPEKIDAHRLLDPVRPINAPSRCPALHHGSARLGSSHVPSSGEDQSPCETSWSFGSLAPPKKRSLTQPITHHPSPITNHQSRAAPYHPRIHANMRGATIVASDSMMYLGVSSDSLPQVIFSFGTAPE
jgi:hypothetical protein